MQVELQANITEPIKPLSTLDRRRPTLYIMLLLFQALNLISNTIIIPASRDSNTLLSLTGAMYIDLVIVLSLTAANIIFLYYFIRNRWMFYTLVSFLALSIVLNIINVSFELSVNNRNAFMIIFGITTLINLGIICYSFFLAVRDIFGESLKMTTSLLGAANIYLLIGSGFAFIYALLNMMMPGTMVADAEIGNLYNTCAINSAYVLGGMDLPDNNHSQFIKNFMMFESIFAHLYAVFIVGRLLSK